MEEIKSCCCGSEDSKKKDDSKAPSAACCCGNSSLTKVRCFIFGIVVLAAVGVILYSKFGPK